MRAGAFDLEAELAAASLREEEEDKGEEGREQQEEEMEGQMEDEEEEEEEGWEVLFIDSYGGGRIMDTGELRCAGMCGNVWKRL